MNTSEVVVSDNGLKIKVNCDISNNSDIFSPMFKIHFIEFKLKGSCNVSCSFASSSNTWGLFIKFQKCVDDGVLYTLTVTSTKLNIKSKTFISDDSDWRVLGCYSNSTISNFNIEINVGTKTSPYLRVFVDDDSLTDFEMKGIDGSVRLHKIVLAAASEVFGQMITNDFKEEKEARVELPYSKSVLNDFKDYFYLNTLNNDNLENLLLLAHCYMINELKQDCINRLLINITTQRSLELIEFAVKNKITELLVAILKIINNKEVDLENKNTNI